jgi:hypothetical protein
VNERKNWKKCFSAKDEMKGKIEEVFPVGRSAQTRELKKCLDEKERMKGRIEEVLR